MGLLDYDIELAKNKLRSLLDAAPEYVNQLTQNVRNITGQNNAANLFAMRNLDAMAGGDLKQNISQNVQEGRDKGMEMALNFNPSAVGMTAWHGSPHKFDKFKLGEHVGTGDGTQMQGVGGYLAQAVPVAERYAGSGGHVYKTDIPDDVIPMMFDLDKPVLSQRNLAEQLNAIHLSDPSLKETMFNAVREGASGQKLYDSLMEKVSRDLKQSGITAGTHPGNLYDEANKIVSQKFKEAGVPGFRYLDQNSRLAGQGSSNFVIFDPNMIRILERNGQATGAQPWKPGEWKGLLGE